MIVLAFLLYFTFFCLGSYFFYKSYPPYKANRAARHWDRVEGEIVEVKVNDRWQSLNKQIGDCEEIQLAYEFEYRGVKYKNDTLSLTNNMIHSRKNKKQTGLFMYDLNIFMEKVRTIPQVYVWVKPNNPNVTIIRNLWGKYMFNILVGVCLVTWGLGLTRLVVVGQYLNGSIKLEEKIEVVEYLPFEEIEIIEAAEAAKEKEATRKGIEANLKWRKEQGLPVD